MTDDTKGTLSAEGPVEPAMNMRSRPNPTRIEGYELFVSKEYADWHKARADRAEAELAASRERERVLREALVRVIAHTSLPPSPSNELLHGLIVSIKRIADAALAAKGEGA